MALAKAYEPKKYEAEIYKLWLESGLFAPSEHGEPYSIVLPPPNATGQLHLGHAVMLGVEDAMVRYQRMQGKSVLWTPGTDHAAIATNAIMERELEREGKTKHDIGREAFLKRLADYVENSRDTIRAQIRAMGASLDWDRERYTMEPAMNRVVERVFVKMYEDGLIYRGHRIVNWDPKLETTVSDDEVERKEEKTSFYTLQYGPFQISTARPETKFGDKYVVMHPDDKRYAKYKHGDKFEAEWINGKVTATVVKDEAVDPEFGTGVMTITPWHDQTDFEIAERHELDREQIIDLNGKLLPVAGEFAGMQIAEARPKIVDKLKDKGLLVKIDDNYMHNIALNSRGGGVIEPQIMLQWFVDVNKPVVKWKHHKMSLKQIMRDVVESGDVSILPGRFDKIYYHWIDSLRDWCISRQIWWGHRIPAWYKPPAKDSKDQSPDIYVGLEPPKDKAYEQDHDTLDTWFSSATWTWSTLLDPALAVDPKVSLDALLKKSPDFKRFHPTNVLETAVDILFFWVARMILMTTYVTGEIPFRDVYLHGLVLDRDGQKMSKSHPETAIDPLGMIDKYGADALRLSMIVGQSPGSNTQLYEEKIAGQRNFCNKLWNVARYAVSNLPEGYQFQEPKAVSSADHWVLARLEQSTRSITDSFESYDFNGAAQAVYHLLWDDFADWYIEASKVGPNHDVLVYGLETILKLTHPLAPFVTEAIWGELPHRNSFLMSEPWPQAQKSDQKASAEFDKIKNLVTEIRNLRSELSLTETRLYHKGSRWLDENSELIKRLSGVVGVHEVSDGHGLHLTSVDDTAWLDVEEQITRGYLFKLIKRRDESQSRIDALEAKLANKQYVSQAPKDLVEETRQNLEQTKDYLKKLKEQIETLERELQLYG